MACRRRVRERFTRIQGRDSPGRHPRAKRVGRGLGEAFPEQVGVLTRIGLSDLCAQRQTCSHGCAVGPMADGSPEIEADQHRNFGARWAGKSRDAVRFHIAMGQRWGRAPTAPGFIASKADGEGLGSHRAGNLHRRKPIRFHCMGNKAIANQVDRFIRDGDLAGRWQELFIFLFPIIMRT